MADVNFHAAAVRFNKPGLLRVAALGTTEPTTYNDAWPTGWYSLGYTDAGSTFNHNTSQDNVTVEEEIDVFARVTTGRDASVEVALAEMTYRNLLIAFNGGILADADTDTAWEFEPPDLGYEVPVMLGWDALADYTTTSPAHTGLNDLRFIFRQVKNSGSMNTQNRKGTQKQTISLTLGLEKPLSGAKVLKIMGADTLNPVTGA
jgi:hypothetical protein